jgi:hypothetical protein
MTVCMAQGVYEPEVFAAGERLPGRDPFAEKLAWMMDGMFKVGPWSVGLDGLIGLIPGLGDIAGALIGMLIVVRAVQAGIPRVAVARMVTNIAIDTFVGSIPILGDAFDFAYKSNTKNLRIYEDALRRPHGGHGRHWGFFAFVFLLIAAVIGVFVVGLIALVQRVAPGLQL